VYQWFMGISNWCCFYPWQRSVESIFCNGFSDNKVMKYGGDSLLDDCLVTFTERNIFFEVGEDDIIKIFMFLRKRQIK